jgi:hypothetical protein
VRLRDLAWRHGGMYSCPVSFRLFSYSFSHQPFIERLLDARAVLVATREAKKFGI